MDTKVGIPLRVSLAGMLFFCGFSIAYADVSVSDFVTRKIPSVS